MGERLKIQKDGLYLEGKPFYLASGDFHYFRTLPGGWEKRMKLMKDFGLNTIQTYCPWNAHEPRKGQFCFDGHLNLAGFLQLAARLDMKVLLRPAGYICAEWEFGGLPYWLMKERDIAIRSSDPVFMAHLRSYTERLCREFVPYLSTNGGPIIAVAVENEYGSFGTDQEYLKLTRQMLEEFGVDVPFYSANGHDVFKLKNGYCGDDIWRGVDFGFESKVAVESLRKDQPDKPPFCTEFWSGRIMHWEANANKVDPEKLAGAYRDALEAGAYVNFYMFCGGSDFGFMNGANYYTSFVAQISSYDYDTLVSEEGEPTDKYYACRREFDRYLKRPVRPREERTRNIQVPKATELTQCAGLFDNLDAVTENCVCYPKPKTMEQMDQNYGFILYTTTVAYSDDRVRHLQIEGLHDRALVWVDGEFKGTMMRDRDLPDVTFTVRPGGSKLQILVENMGRLSYGNYLYDEKGILKGVRVEIENEDGSYLWNKAFILNWETRSLPMSDLSKLSFGGPVSGDVPAFYRGSFDAKPGVDTFIEFPGWDKGVVWINGMNLGRYWKVGPQQTTYVPGEILKEHNEIVVLDLQNRLDKRMVNFRDTSELNAPIASQEIATDLFT